MAPSVEVAFTNASFTANATEPYFVSDNGIEGRITIRNSARDGFDLVKISLEGVLLNSIKYKNSRNAQPGAAKKFQVLLRMADVKKRSDFVRIVESGKTIAKSSFRFHIPHCLGRNLLGEDSEYLSDLPGSLSCSETPKIGPNSVQFSWGQSHVFYTIRADVIGHETTLSTVMKPVRIIPALKSRPPVCISDFGKEYTICKTKTVKGKGRLSLNRIGECTVRVVEPEPVTLRRLNDPVTLPITLNIVLTPITPRGRQDGYPSSEQNIEPTLSQENKVSSALVSSTYVSVVPRRGVPTPAEADKSEKLVRRESICSRATADLKSMNGWSQDRKSGSWQTIMTTKLKFEDFAHKEPLTPTFDSSLVSHRYRIALRINLSLPSRVSFVLDIPVMLRYCSPNNDQPPSFDEIHPPLHIIPNFLPPIAETDVLGQHSDEPRTHDILLDPNWHSRRYEDADPLTFDPRVVGISAPPYVI